eukprot:SAG31_NODE_7545_length_1659_cov_1.344231_1_plen_381_part_00
MATDDGKLSCLAHMLAWHWHSAWHCCNIQRLRSVMLLRLVVLSWLAILVVSTTGNELGRLGARRVETLQLAHREAFGGLERGGDRMGARQRLLMAAYARAAQNTGPPPAACSQAEVYSWMYTLSAGNATERAAVLRTLSALPTRCPNFLLPMSAGFAGSSSCSLMRVCDLASNATDGLALPLASRLAIARALLNMSANPFSGSLWSFVSRRQGDGGMEIDNSENLDLATKMPVSLALEIIVTLPGPEFGPALRLPDGHTVAEHCAAWSHYWHSYFTSRALYGINVETSSTTYSKYFMEELACMHDLTRSASLRSLVSDYMQVYFADSAIEYISTLGVRGGAKSRVYHDHYSLDDSDPLGEVGWLLGWTGNDQMVMMLPQG